MTSRQRFYSSFAFLCLILCLAACTRDPNVRKQKYVDSGNRYLDAGKPREAGIEFANAVKIDPSFAAAHYGLARSYMVLGVYPSAFAELNKTVELDPNNLQAELDLGNFYVLGSKGNPDGLNKAVEKANFVLSKDPNNAHAYALLATTAATQGKLQEALAQMQKAVSLAPSDASLQLTLGTMQEAQKNYSVAESIFKGVLQANPKSLQAYDLLVGLYATQKQWSNVEQMLQTAIQAIPNNLPLRLELASFYISPGQNKKEQAQQVIEQAKKVAGDDANARRAIAEFEYNNGNTEEAFRDFASLVNDHPKDAVAKGRYAELLLQKNRDDEAKKQTDELLKSSPKDVLGRTVKAQLLLKQHQPNDALKILQEVVKDEPKNALAHYFLGVAYQSTGDSGQAEAEWRESVRLNSRLLPGYRALAVIAQQKNDFDLLQTAADGIINSAPNSAEGYLRRATVHFGHKDYAAGEQDIKKAIEVDPNNPDGYSALAELRLQQKKTADANALFEQALKASPGAVRPMQGIVAIDLSQKQPDKAKARLKAQIALSPNTGAFYIMLAGLQADAKDYPGAEATLREGMSLDKDNIQGYLLLGRIQGMTGNVDQAISTYQTYIQRNPRELTPYLAVGELEESRKNFQNAKQMYEKALSIDPDSAAANNNLAYLMLESGDNIDLAITKAQAARRLMPDSPSVADTLGYAYVKKGVYSSAVDLLEEAVRKDPNSAAAHYHLGLAYSKLNNASKAREQFLKASQLAPATSEGIAAKKELESLGGKA